MAISFFGVFTESNGWEVVSGVGGWRATRETPIVEFTSSGVKRGSNGDASFKTLNWSLIQTKADGVSTVVSRGSGSVTASEGTIPISNAFPIGDNEYELVLTGRDSHDNVVPGSKTYILRSFNDTDPPLMTLRSKTNIFSSADATFEVDVYDSISATGLKVDVELNGQALPTITTFPSDFTVPAANINNNINTLKVVATDGRGNATQPLRYKFRADSWNKDTLQTVKVFNVRSYKTNATLANTAGIVFLYTNKVPLITKAANTVIDDSLVAAVTYPSAELFNWSVPDYETIDTANNVLKYADDIHTLTYNQNLKSNNNIYIETTDVSTDTNMTPFNFLNGSSVIDEELYLFIGMTDPEVEITVEEVSVVPAPTKVSFNVVSPPANVNNVHVFYNPIYINAELGAASPVNKELTHSGGGGNQNTNAPLGTFTQNCGNVSGLQICIEEVNVYANAITGTIEFGSNKWRKYDQNSTDPNVDWFRFMLYEDDILIYTSHNFNPGGFAIDYSSSASNIFSGKYQFTVYPSTTLEPDKEYKIRVDGRDYDNFSTNEEVTVVTTAGATTNQSINISSVNVPILSTYPGVPLSLFNQFYKIEADDIAAEIYGFAYDRAFDIRFLPGLNANVANVIFFNSGGITPGETSTIKESLLVKYDSFTNIINPSPPISGGPALTPVTAIVENVEIGHEPNYHSRII